MGAAGVWRHYTLNCEMVKRIAAYWSHITSDEEDCKHREDDPTGKTEAEFLPNVNRFRTIGESVEFAAQWIPPFPGKTGDGGIDIMSVAWQRLQKIVGYISGAFQFIRNRSPRRRRQ